VQTNVLIKEECILKSKNKLCPFKKLSVFITVITVVSVRYELKFDMQLI
jgi:hypothetical protein